MKFIRFKATDDVELQGWLSDQASDIAAIHIHGMSGNGYENHFLDNLRDLYTQRNIAFLSVDTRGRGVVSDFRQGDGWKHAGSCFEIFEESIHDIQGALEYLRSIGKRRFILQAHSLGCSKVVNALANSIVNDIEKVILLAPTNMVGWAALDTQHEAYLANAREFVMAGKNKELVGSECWLSKTPLSAETYLTLSEVGGPADIYGDRENGALLSHVDIPTLIVCGEIDVGVTDIYGSVDKWLDEVNKIKHLNTEVHTIPGAPHSFRGSEDRVREIVSSFIEI